MTSRTFLIVSNDDGEKVVGTKWFRLWHTQTGFTLEVVGNGSTYGDEYEHLEAREAVRLFTEHSVDLDRVLVITTRESEAMVRNLLTQFELWD